MTTEHAAAAVRWPRDSTVSWQASIAPLSFLPHFFVICYIFYC